ncbi:MAG TPA: molybdenum cofactor guanylyltransferase [Thermomicrobiaceae bacterium]|nr:molybdenum cofactor guanylyltransferase [Thermomicrobiaceae bacterium]
MDPLSVAVLAGGRSRRMGRDKASAPLGDASLLDRVLDRVAGVGQETILVTADAVDARPGVRNVVDEVPGRGGLGGIHAALRAATYAHCLVVACDMPFLNRSLLRYMAEEPRDYDVLVPSLDAGRSDQGESETLETLHAIYGRACLPTIERRLVAGSLKLADLLDDLRVRRIPESVVHRYDPDLLSFFNANTPDDLSWATEHLREFDARRAARREAGRSDVA